MHGAPIGGCYQCGKFYASVKKWYFPSIQSYAAGLAGHNYFTKIYQSYQSKDLVSHGERIVEKIFFMISWRWQNLSIIK